MLLSHDPYPRQGPPSIKRPPISLPTSDCLGKRGTSDNRAINPHQMRALPYHQTHFLSLASHLRPTSSHPKTPSLLRKAGGSGFPAISHTTTALAPPTTCRLFLRHMEQTIRSKCFPPKYAVKIPPLLNSSNRSLSFGGTRD